MGLEDLRRTLNGKKNEPLTIRDVWHDNMVVDPYFPQVAMFVAKVGQTAAYDVARKFMIEDVRLIRVLNELLEYRVVMLEDNIYRECP